MNHAKAYMALALLLLASGCYTTTISSGRPVGKVSPEADDTWHSGLVTGGVDLSGDYDLKSLCPNGWAEIHTETSVLNEVVELATYRLYAPQTVRVTCAADGPPRAPAAGKAQPLARARKSTVSRRELGASDSGRVETR